MGREGGGDVKIKVHSQQPDSVKRPHLPAAPAPPLVRPRAWFQVPILRFSLWLVPTVVAVNFVLFLVTMYVNNCPKNSDHCLARFLGPFSFEAFKTNPLLGPSARTLDNMGALDVYEVVEKKQIWRLFSCIWLHGGVFHVLANMLGLLVIGIQLEQDFGSARIGLVYLISGLGGSLFSALFIEKGISVGASGALFGLLGGMLSELLTNWTIYEKKLAALLILIVIILANLALGLLPHMDNFAHIGGFLTGFLAGFVILLRPQYGWVRQRNSPLGHMSSSLEPKHKVYQYFLWVVSLILLIAEFAVGLSFLLKGINMNDYCSWCHYLSCVPSSKWSCAAEKPSCESHQTGNQLNLTCLGNSRSSIYYLSDRGPSDLEKLCSLLCRL